MNQKDYKEIAGIINCNLRDSNDKRNVAIAFADYLEKEKRQSLLESGIMKHQIETALQNEFNRQQFLKDCGIK